MEYMTVKNSITYESCILRIKVAGCVINRNVNWDDMCTQRMVKYNMHGFCNDTLDLKPFNGETGASQGSILWKRRLIGVNLFNISEFIITLNGLPDDLNKYFCKTESSLKYDLRAMEGYRRYFASYPSNYGI